MSVAIVTGASRGLGLELARGLATRGWKLVIDARGADALERAAAELRSLTEVHAIPGDVFDEEHRRALADVAEGLGGLDLLVNNAGVLGPSPQPQLAEYPLQELRAVYEINVFAPLRLTQLALPMLERSRGAVINVSSDAAVEGYEGWGGYGSSKAALEQLGNVLAAEHQNLAVWSVDPGDMRTKMHQDAYPGEDISDRQSPSEPVPALLALIEGRSPSGRYRISELLSGAPR
jgi:NAD(P)-dependent dehydrogenase (short-subunit alcohol dehydrogenase family)